MPPGHQAVLGGVWSRGSARRRTWCWTIAREDGCLPARAPRRRGAEPFVDHAAAGPVPGPAPAHQRERPSVSRGGVVPDRGRVHGRRHGGLRGHARARARRSSTAQLRVTIQDEYERAVPRCGRGIPSCRRWSAARSCGRPEVHGPHPERLVQPHAPGGDQEPAGDARPPDLRHRRGRRRHPGRRSRRAREGHHRPRLHDQRARRAARPGDRRGHSPASTGSGSSASPTGRSSCTWAERSRSATRCRSRRATTCRWPTRPAWPACASRSGRIRSARSP